MQRPGHRSRREGAAVTLSDGALGGARGARPAKPWSGQLLREAVCGQDSGVEAFVVQGPRLRKRGRLQLRSGAEGILSLRGWRWPSPAPPRTRLPRGEGRRCSGAAE